MAPRILIIRPDHLGDLILAGPTGRALAAALPEASIDWLVGPWSAEVTGRVSRPREIMTCPFPGFTRRPKRSPWQPYLELIRQARRLRPRAYDVAVVARPDHWWGALLAKAARIPLRLGYGVAECRPFLTHALRPSEATHVVEQGLGLARLAARLLEPTAQVPSLEPTFTVKADERRWARDQLDQLVEGTSIVAVHPGSGAPVKDWLPERWHELVTELAQSEKHQIVLTGSSAEQPLLARIARDVEPAPLCLAGRTTLGQLAAIFERCHLVVGGDSGPLHLAAAVGTSTLRLYGPTDPKLFGPYGTGASHEIIHASLPCQPCGNIEAPPCGATGTPECLRAVPTERVAEALLRARC